MIEYTINGFGYGLDIVTIAFDFIQVFAQIIIYGLPIYLILGLFLTVLIQFFKIFGFFRIKV